MKTKTDIQVVHALPDRVRLKLHRLKNNMAYAEEIQRQLHQVQGITHLETNPKTGSLLIQYDPAVLKMLALHPSIASSLGLPPDVKHLNKNAPPAKGRVKSLKIVRKAGTKIEGKAKSDKTSKNAIGKS
ncbi:HMA2 domain-containing protein [Nitrospira sp. T9]|uniref:HMA2 domain-containing protein n=1 Tax=unclassified Nitrospira TaxID=2652172 RepID=UPI003F958512